MAFQLVIAEGKEAGREFVFDQPSILIGRTDECDVVLYEGGVSRKHARLYEEDGKHFLEDLGSSNGTLLNGERVSKQQLKDGDTIGLGAVTFTFTANTQGQFPTDAAPVPLEEGGAHTRVVSAAEMKRSRNKGVAMLPKGAGLDELRQVQRRSTAMMPAIKDIPLPKASAPRSSGPRRALSSPGKASPSPIVALEPASTEATVPPEGTVPPEAPPPAPESSTDAHDVGAIIAAASAPPAPPAVGDDQADTGQVKALAPRAEAPLAAPQPRTGTALLASERMRLKRDGTRGRLKLWWLEAGFVKKLSIVLSSAILVTGAVAGAAFAWRAIRGDFGGPTNEPRQLVTNADPIPDSFGVGDDVQWQRVDQKAFEVELRSASKSVVVLSFQAKDLSSNELTVQLNGGQAITVEADTVAAAEETREIVFPPDDAKRGEKNFILFDNTHNPPGKDKWRIWNVAVTFTPVPQEGIEALFKQAEESYDRGKQRSEQRNIASANLWEAYRAFRETWLMLESVPHGRENPVYELARTQMKELRGELDKKCRQLLLEVRRDVSERQPDRAASTLDHVKDYFPTRQHPCQYEAEVMREELML